MGKNRQLKKLFFGLPLLTLLVFFPLNGQALDANEIVMFLPDTDWPPYVTSDDENNDNGVFVEVFKAIAEPMGYTVKVKCLPDPRGWRMLDEGVVDVHVKARKWVESPDRYLWTDPFMLNEDVLLYLRGSTLKNAKPEDLYGRSVAAIRGFVYPTFEAHFGLGKINRVDVSSPYAMLELLDRNRVDAAMVNRAETLWLMQNRPELYHERFRMDEKPFDKAEYRFLFSRKGKWLPFVRRFNKALGEMKQDGRLEAIIDRYR